MLDFMMVSMRETKRGIMEIYPDFIMTKTSDLMIRGGDFYAIWDEERQLWSMDEHDAIRLIDAELDIYVKENSEKINADIRVLYMWNADSGMIDKWHKYCQKQMRDSFHVLDETLIFSNTKVNKHDYASKKLGYPLVEGSFPAYEKLISTLYSEAERRKIEWAIGAIITGESKTIQKFMVLYGAAGTGKSTILNIIQLLFEGYYAVFDAKALGSSNNSFALEAFKNNPLVAIQHDGDLSKIEDNTRLNSLVSHELMTVNEKFKSTYANRFKCFLFMGTNKPVKITDGKSGLIRRLIDVSPSGNKLPAREYKQAMKQIPFELGAIAYHCKEVYLDAPDKYDDYIPVNMLGASNDFYNFIIDAYHVFKRDDGTTLKAAWEMYKTYCEEARVPYPFSQRNFKEELKNYFWEYNDRFNLGDGSRVRSYYSKFKTDIFDDGWSGDVEDVEDDLIQFGEFESVFDKEYAGCPAQYASSKETPITKWDNIKSTLEGLDSKKLHYVMPPVNHVVIDFDIKGSDGKKSFDENLKAASRWPPTYAELSKSEAGIHLHYNYNGDVSKLSHIYSEDVEIKVFTGKSSLRRKLTKCNNLPIATISSGLPLKGGDKTMLNVDSTLNEKGLRTAIKRNLNKEYHGNTSQSINFIEKLLNDAYDSGMKYDVSDLYDAVLSFAANSSNQAERCLEVVDNMHFKSDEPSAGVDVDAPIAFYDIEIFPNLFLVNWKLQGEGKPMVRMINPTASEVEDLIKFRLIGFNCRRYDNHILYARLMGYDNAQLYKLSQRIISGDKNAFFGEAYNLSYTDVYDFATKKQSLKKWEIELGIHHKELGIPWDKPVPEERWVEVAEYCDNDVLATEAVFNSRQADFAARKIQVDLVKTLHSISNVTVNDTTNTLSTKIIFGNNRKPQASFNYRDLAKPVGSDQYETYRKKFGKDYVFRVFDSSGLPLYKDYVPGEDLPHGWSILPFFKGYVYDHGKSVYLDEEIGEGGKVYAEPGMYGNVWDGDIASQHPHSAIFEVLFGLEFTKIFEDIVKARVAIKHRDFELAGSLLNGVLKPYLNEEQADALAQALKIVINSIYGLTSATFENPFRDIRNKDNIVAKRGALFMTLLKHEVQKKGYTVAHIKTDSIKIPDADESIKEFVIKFGKEFGYTFETEANFEKFCLVNNAVYVAKHKDGKLAGKWTATGKQFAVPYVFKSLFAHEPITVNDMRETFSVKTALYLDMNENLPDVSKEEKEHDKLLKKISDPKQLDKDMSKECARVEELSKIIDGGHNYCFIGKVGEFYPVKPGMGGGLLCREQNGKYHAAAGTIGYRWIETEVVAKKSKDKAITINPETGKEDEVLGVELINGSEEFIDRSYYDRLVDEAIDTISKYGDFEWFVSDDPYIPNKLPRGPIDPDIPFDPDYVK